MTAKNLARQIAEGGVNRRQIMRALAGAGIGICAMPLISRNASAAIDLTIFEWSGYELPKFHPEFAAKYGGEPTYTFFADEEEALQKIRAGFRPDLSHPCTASVRRWRDAGVIEAIDTSRIERWNEIIPELFRVKGMVIDGKHYMMPWDFGTSQIVYNADRVHIEKPTFDLMVDPAYAGKVSWNDQVDTALVVGGVIAGLDNIFDPSEGDMKKLREVWKRGVKASKFLWSDGTQISQAVASGEVVATYMWTSDMVNLRKQGLTIKTISPIMPWVCGLVINAKGPGSKDQAYDYLNAMLDPTGGAALVTEDGYGHANRNTFAKVDPSVLATYGLEDPVAMLSQGIFFDEIPPAKREALIKMWDEVKAGI